MLVLSAHFVCAEIHQEEVYGDSGTEGLGRPQPLQRDAQVAKEESTAPLIPAPDLFCRCLLFVFAFVGKPFFCGFFVVVLDEGYLLRDGKTVK